MMEATKVLHKKKVIVPKLRFKGIETGWRNMLYSDIYTFYTTNSFSRDNLNYESGEVKNIHYGDIHTRFATLFDIQKEEVPFINTEIDIKKIKDESFCQEKDLVIADASEDYADIGKTIELVNLNNEKIIAGLHTFLARPNKHEMAKGFAGYLVQSWKFRKQVMVIAQGTKVLSLSTGRLGNLKLNIPTIPEQQKIASFLSAVDEKIQKLTRKKELLEQYKKGVMQQLFSGKLRFKDENGIAFPKWEEKRLGDVCECMDNLRKPLNDSQRQLMQGEIPYWGANKIMDYVNDYLFDETLVLLAEDGGNFNEYETRPIANLSKGKCWVNNHTHVLKGKKNLSNEFLFYSLVHKNITGFVSGGTRAKLNKSEMLKIPIAFPYFEEQKKIANYLSKIDAKIESINNQITQNQTFKRGLLQQMFV